MTSQCDLCAYYWIDEEDGTGECQVNLDEDDLARMLSGSSDSCPYFQMDDEYKIVRKQMQNDIKSLPEVVATKQEGVDTSKEGLNLNKAASGCTGSF